MRTRPIFAWTVIAALTTSGLVMAQGKPAPKPTTAAPAAKQDPKALYAGAVKKFGDKDYAGALADFQTLDALKTTPQSQRYIALCLDKLGKTAEAVTWYEKFVANPIGKMQTEHEEAKKRLEELNKKPKLHIESTPSSALILVDGKVVGLTPQDVEVTAGKHLVHIELAGYESVDKDVDAASERDVRAKLEKKAEPVVATTTPQPQPQPDASTTANPEPTPSSDAPKSEKPPTFIPGIVTGGLAAVSLGFGIGFGVAALGNKSDFDKNPNTASADAGRTNAVACEVFFAGAIALGLTSVVLLLNKNGSSEPKPVGAVTIHPHPIVTPHGGGVGALVRF